MYSDSPRYPASQGNTSAARRRRTAFASGYRLLRGPEMSRLRPECPIGYPNPSTVADRNPHGQVRCDRTHAEIPVTNGYSAFQKSHLEECSLRLTSIVPRPGHRHVVHEHGKD